MVSLASAVSEADLYKTRVLAQKIYLNERPSPDSRIRVANGHLQTPSEKVELQFEVGDMLFNGQFPVMNHLTSPFTRLFFLQRNSTISDMRQGVLIFLFFSIQLKPADNTYSKVN